MVNNKYKWQASTVKIAGEKNIELSTPYFDFKITTTKTRVEWARYSHNDSEQVFNQHRLYIKDKESNRNVGFVDFNYGVNLRFIKKICENAMWLDGLISDLETLKSHDVTPTVALFEYNN